uniref:SAM domain-containing protein n=1 Tax=Timema poppense TaxID=170557 RepID=A0A7R9CQZ4_TIMPO|nr:unnamed protein product [Timema poppensis]
MRQSGARRLMVTCFLSTWEERWGEPNHTASLDNAVLVYIHSFLNNEVNGQQLLNLRPDDLNHLGVHKLGHQELILEAVEHLRNFAPCSGNQEPSLHNMMVLLKTMQDTMEAIHHQMQ